jgi:hypothetical protein
VRGAYEQKENQVYFHLHQMAHRFDFPLRTNDHFHGDCLNVEGHARLSEPIVFPPFTFLYLVETYSSFTPN